MAQVVEYLTGKSKFLNSCLSTAKQTIKINTNLFQSLPKKMEQIGLANFMKSILSCISTSLMNIGTICSQQNISKPNL
jgi:hypothetical protein